MRIEDATDVFCRSFVLTRSFTHPFEFVRFEGLRVMRDAAPKKPPRVQEIVIHGLDPDDALRQIVKYDPPRHFLCAILACEDDFIRTKAAYKAGGYRMLGTEDFFVRDLEKPIQPPIGTVTRIISPEAADRVFRAAGKRQIPLAELKRDVVRLYAAFVNDEIGGWVKSIHIDKQATWASNLYVRPEFRRRGLGSALMSQMLLDDKAHGASTSVLLASHVGSKLYPLLGYERIGTLLMFSPKQPRS